MLSSDVNIIVLLKCIDFFYKRHDAGLMNQGQIYDSMRTYIKIDKNRAYLLYK